MNSNEILKFCLEKGLLLDKNLLNLLNEISDVDAIKIFIDKFQHYTKKRVITSESLSEEKAQINKIFTDLPELNQKNLEKLKIQLGLNIEISREIIPPSVVQLERVFQGSEVKVLINHPAVSKKLEVKDFVRYFLGRYTELREVLQKNLEETISIDKISGNKKRFSIIAMVSNKRITKNKNLILDVEDPTGKIKVIINKDKEDLYKSAEEIPLDSVLGFKGSGSREIFFANEIIFPEVSLPERKKSFVDESVVFLGDLHIGSKLFMEKNFLDFIDYLNGKFSDTAEEIKKIKYLFICGDLVAGVGIYPGQEKELNIQDIEEQYTKAAELLEKIREDIKIIISPGNHDAVRIMEPQPVLDEKFAWALYNLKNVLLISNPSLVNIGARMNFSGFNILNYHGYSYHYYAGNVSRLILEKAVHKPERIMEYLLKYRHLAPTHASTLYFPGEKDPLIISTPPDIFVSAHTHKSGLSYFNNILLVSTSSWESLTAFEERMGNEPDFCKVPMFNLKTRTIKILDFE